MIDLGTLSMTEIIRLQNQLQQELTRRFECCKGLAFSDIVGSTEYFARFGDAAGRQLQQLHFDLLSQCLPALQGRIVDTAGDGAFMVFPTADAAVRSLIDFQKLLSTENAKRARDQQLMVRIGIHFGPVLTDGVVVSGDSVNLCSRVAASAEIGEIRLTREVFQELPTTHRVNCLLVGAVELKGVSRQVELFRLDWRDRSLFPTHVHIQETDEDVSLPQQDIISFGRIREHAGALANDVVLDPRNPAEALKISRWHFELRRLADGFHLRVLSDSVTEVEGQVVPKGSEVVVKPGTKIGVGRVLTLTLISPVRKTEEDSFATRLVG